MKLGLGIKATLSQTLTPQQIQYLKLLQLPVMQLEVAVRQEIEMNPMLEDSADDYDEVDYLAPSAESSDFDNYDTMDVIPATIDSAIDTNDYLAQKEYIDDKPEPFEFHDMLWDADPESNFNPNYSPDDDENDNFQIKDNLSFYSEIINQLRFLNLPDDEFKFTEELIGNIDEDGYLRRDLEEIVNEYNSKIAEINFEESYNKQFENTNNFDNPAALFALDQSSKEVIKNSISVLNGKLPEKTKKEVELELTSLVKKHKPITLDRAEILLTYIRHLDPAGIGSRNLRECLLAQLTMKPKLNAAQKLAKLILEDYYDAFSKKHYLVIIKNLEIGEDYLKDAIDAIKSLNPKPGGTDYQNEMNSVIPDFHIEYDDEKDDLIITVNDTRVPQLQLSKTYDNMRKEVEYRKYNKETKDWIRQKREDAKFLIQALKQRKSTMIKVMTSIAKQQRDFFLYGSEGLKPLIYKNIQEDTTLDISTVCRIVNGKYVSTRFGTYELKYFFSESLPSDDGDDVSTKVIKEALRKIIEDEPKGKPYSDDKLSKKLKELGYNVARRTVAKYREQLNLPVARLRVELV